MIALRLEVESVTYSAADDMLAYRFGINPGDEIVAKYLIPNMMLKKA